KSKFDPEFIDRLTEVVVYRPLSRADKNKILDIEIGKVWYRALRSLSLTDSKLVNTTFTLSITNALRSKILAEAEDKSSARRLKLVVDKYIAGSISRILASNQLTQPGTIILDYRYN